MDLLPHCQTAAANAQGSELPKGAPKGALLPWQSAFGQLLPLPLAMAVTGIYKLIRNQKVVYVGVGKNILKRVREHRQHKNITFDDVQFLELTHPAELRALEKRLVRLHRPQHNNQHNPIQHEFTEDDIWDQLRDRDIETATLRDE